MCVDSAQEHIIDSVLLIHNPEKRTRIGAVLWNLSNDHINLGIYAYFVDGKPGALKQHLSLASLLAFASTHEDGGQTLSHWDLPLYAMLSDNPRVIDLVAHLEPDDYLKNRDNPRLPQFVVHMLQLALRGEHDALQAKIERGAKGSGKQLREEFRTGQDFFSLLLRQDQDALEALILQEAQWWETIRKKGKETGLPLFEDLFAANSLLHAKLCWLKGIPVRVDHPLVPKDLLPVNPLPHYDDVYDFLLPGWVTPKRGLWGKVSRWLAR